ncbi:MAG: hypothetical protein AAF193_09390, partial [Bacteroidota bacterium]
PGDGLSYTITGSNIGTTEACGVYVTDTLPSELTLVNPTHNFATLVLTDVGGNPMLPIDSNGADITNPVAVSYSQSLVGDDILMKWDINNGSSATHDDICIPAGAYFEFQVFTQVNADVEDGTLIVNPAHIDSNQNDDANDGNDETNQDNNDDDSSVTVYRADVTINKSGISSNEDQDGVVGSPNAAVTQDPEVFTEVGDTVTYSFEYENVGNADASDVVISETIPAGTCYKVGSNTTIPGAVLEYSDDDGATWAYTPVAGSEGEDCAVKNFRYVLGTDLPPGNFEALSCVDEQNCTLADHIDADTYVQTTFDDMTDLDDELGAGQIQLIRALDISESGNYNIRSGSVHSLSRSDDTGVAVWIENSPNSFDVYVWEEGIGKVSVSDLIATGNTGSATEVRSVIDANDVVHVVWTEGRNHSHRRVFLPSQLKKKKQQS